MLRLFLSSFSVTLVGVACAFASQLVLARILPAAEYGAYSFIFSLSLMLGVFALFGFQNSVVRLIPQFLNDEKQRHKVKRLLGFSIFFVGVLAGGVGVFVYGGLSFTPYADMYSSRAFVVGIALVALMALMRLMSAFMRGFSKSAVSVLYETSLREILFLLAIGGALLFGFDLRSGFDALLLLAGSLMVVVIIAAFHVRSQEPDVGGDGAGARGEDYRAWLSISFPMMLTIFAQRFLRRSDVVILGFMVSPVLVGAYAIVAQFSDVSAIGQKGIFAVFGSRAATLFAAGEHDTLRRMYWQMALYGIVSAAVLSVLIAVCAPVILGYFGESYGAGYSALLILLIGQFVTVCFGPIGLLMVMTKYEQMSMRLTVMAALGNLICNPLAIYFYGLEGAAVVTAFFLVLRGAMSVRFMRKEGVL